MVSRLFAYMSGNYTNKYFCKKIDKVFFTKHQKTRGYDIISCDAVIVKHFAYVTRGFTQQRASTFMCQPGLVISTINTLRR